jgi:hypothetical protein
VAFADQVFLPDEGVQGGRPHSGGQGGVPPLLFVKLALEHVHNLYTLLQNGDFIH